jgi:hypothetical protein
MKMKKALTLALIGLTTWTLPTSSVQAGDDEAIAAIGGFVLGLVTGSIAKDSGHNGYRHSDTYYRNRSHTRYSNNYSSYRHDSYDRHHVSQPTGRWETRRVKKWVPGFWEVRYNHCGDRIKVWRNGHYRYETERVWVSFCDIDRHYRR